MTLWSCATCGIEFADTAEPLAICPVCADERQYLPPGGQKWTTQAEIREGRSATIDLMEEGLYGITVNPRFGIGHRPLLVQTPNGNVLWDASGFFDDALLRNLDALGGVTAIASSHPHLVGACVSISHHFGHAPLYWNADDAEWIQRPDDAFVLWRGSKEILPGVTLVQCGGHFTGSAVLHYAGADGRGFLLTGDTIRVNTDRATLSFMRSYPNLIPLPPRAINQIVAAVEPFGYDRIYGGFEGEVIDSGAKAKVRASADRYIAWEQD